MFMTSPSNSGAVPHMNEQQQQQEPSSTTYGQATMKKLVALVAGRGGGGFGGLVVVVVILVMMMASMAAATESDSSNNSGNSSSSHLSSLVELDSFLQNPNTTFVERQGNVNVYNSTTTAQQHVCRLEYMVGFSTISRATGQRIPTNQYFALEGAAAVALALQHLNTGNGSVVPELEGLQCDIQFDFQARDSYWNQQQSVNQIIDLTTSSTPEEAGSCAFLGNVFSRVTMSTALITSMKGYLQMGYSTATELEDRELFPLASRIVPSLTENTETMIRYIREQLGVRYLAVLHTDTRESQSYSVALQQAAVKLAPDLTLRSFDIPDEVTPQIMQQVVTQLKDTQFTYFLSATKAAHFELLWNETIAQGIAGTGHHTWLLPIGDNYFRTRIYERDSAPAKAIPGLHLVRLSGFHRHPVYDRLTEALKNLGQNQHDKDLILSKLPVYPDMAGNLSNSPFAPILMSDTFLQRPLTSGLSTWAYDSAIAVGLAACNASNAVPLTGKTHFEALTHTHFHGASGNVTFDPITGTRRNPRYKIVNVQYDPDLSNDTHVRFREVTTGLYVDHHQWIPFSDPVFNDGTTNMPPDLPLVEIDDNHLSTALRAVSLTLCAMVVLLALCSSLWVLVHNETRVVRSAQPIFLHLLFLGVIVTELSIVPLSIDEGAANSEWGCHVACQSFPWLLSVGFSLTFSALCAKTHRVNKLLQNVRFRRITVSAWDVTAPMLLALSANVLVLSLWTALSPLQCETEILVWDEFDRAMETRGYCASSGQDDIAYVTALGVINLGPLVFAVYEAYRARDISTEYAETDYILKTLIVISLVCFMGIPVLVIASDNPSAYFFVLSAIIFVVGMTILILIFGPKLIAYYDISVCSSRDNRRLPLRFSRGSTKRMRGGSTSEMAHSSSMLALGSQEFVSDLSNVSGLMILSHPGQQEELKEENGRLRLENADLKKRLKKDEDLSKEKEEEQQKPEQMPTSTASLNDASFAGDDDDDERNHHQHDNEETEDYRLKKLMDENEGLRKRLGQQQPGTQNFNDEDVST